MSEMEKQKCWGRRRRRLRRAAGVRNEEGGEKGLLEEGNVEAK